MGHPLIVPAGMLICGKPETPEVQVRRMTLHAEFFQFCARNFDLRRDARRGR